MNLSSAAAGLHIGLAADRDAGACESEGLAHYQRAFDACADSLYRYFAVRTGDAHLADDLMQQLWLQARSGAATVPVANFEYWLRAIAKNLLRTQWRIKARRPAHVPVADPELASQLADRLVSAEMPVCQLEQREVRDQLLLALTSLAASEQELIIASYFQNHSHAALAQQYDVSERAIEGRLYRARQSLRKRLMSLADE